MYRLTALFMRTVVLYYGKVGSVENYRNCYCFPEEYAKPMYLLFFARVKNAIFAVCDKYGCRQFNPWPNGIRPFDVDELDVDFNVIPFVKKLYNPIKI